MIAHILILNLLKLIFFRNSVMVYDISLMMIIASIFAYFIDYLV